MAPRSPGVKILSAPGHKGVFHDMEYVTYSSLFQYTLVIVGITAVFIEWFSRKK